MKKISIFNNKILIIFIIIKCITNSLSKIFLPIETLSFDNYIISPNISTHELQIKSLLSKNIFTILQIGTPIQKIPLLINTKEHFFEITSYTPLNTNNNYNINFNLSSIFIKYDFFKENNSLSYKTNGCIKSNNMFSDHLFDCDSFDIIYLEEKIKIKNFEFNLVKNKEENITGILGLGLFDKTGDINKSFLKILKNKGIIKEYNWYFFFDNWNDTNGKLIIGSLPHEDFPDLFSKDDLEYTYIPLNDYSFLSNSYKIQFNEIYMKSDNKSIEINLYNVNSELNFDFDVIIANKQFENELKIKFLKNFIIFEKCFKDTIKLDINYYNELIYYYCDINIKNILYEILPSIKFFSQDLNYTFEITKDDLFKINKDYIYINILFDYGKNYWILGKPISLKYPFVFNQDTKKIGLYRNYNKNKIINKQKDSYYYKKLREIFLIIIFGLILIFIGFFFGKKIYQMKRKKRANELNDCYEYINENEDKNKNNFIDNNNAILEMGLKL